MATNPEDQNQGTNTEDVKVADDKGSKKFTPEQQDIVSGLVNDAFGKGAAKVQKQLDEAKSLIDSLKGEVENLKKATAKKEDTKQDDKGKNVVDDKALNAEIEKVKADGRTKEAKWQAQFDELMGNFNTIKTERDQLKTEKEQAHKAAKEMKFASAFDEAAGDQFFKSKTVRLELAEQLKHEDDGTITVLNPRTGQPRLNSDMQPFTLKDLLAEYAKNNPHMVKTEVAGGSGASETRKTDTKTATKSIKDMSEDEIKALEKRVALGERIPVS